MYKLPQTLTEDIAYFSTLIDEFKQGKIEPVKFKGTRVPMGIYEQRKDGTYMVRVRCTGGYISPEQLKQIALTAQSHSSPFLHITTRQEIQIHHIAIDQVKTILPELQQVELSSKGGGGNTVRNILVDINSGISKNEVFDVLPYAVDVTTKLIAEPDSFTLPRKLKIAFSTSELNSDFAIINDLGFIAKTKDGKRGFKVFLGGSVASNPTIGWKLFDFVGEEELFNIAVAAKHFFSNHGNRKNRHKARIRYIFYKEGEEKTKELFFNYYNEIKAKENFVYTPGQLNFTYTTPSFATEKVTTPEFAVWKKRYATRQAQEGKFAVLVPFVNGNTDAETLIALADFAASFGNDVLRFTPRQQLQFRNIPEAYLGNLYLLLQKLNIGIAEARVVNNVVSCTGADTCRLGICYSKGAASALRKKLSKSSLALDEIEDLQINISGCPNSCAQHRWSDIGFAGKVARNDRMFPAYSVYAGANRSGEGKLGDPVGTVSAKDLPNFVQDLLSEYLAVKENYIDFNEYITGDGLRTAAQLVDKYGEVPSFDEDKNYYFDWGSEEIFSVVNKGPAECSAGLFDMIEVDQRTIKADFASLETETNRQVINGLLHDIVFSSSRMLLVTKGAEPHNTTETFELFIEKFIGEGLVDKRFLPIVETAKTNPEADLTAEKQTVLDLGNAVIQLYESMDDSLQFKNIPALEIKETAPVAATDDTPVTKDLRGVACPMNFVKTKLELAKLRSGDLLEVWLDDGQPIQNVPGSVRNEGHEIKSVTQVQDYWKVLIKKA